MTWTSDLPTQPGHYWMQHNPPNREIVVEVLEIEGVMMVRWPNIDQPVVKLNAKWCGPIKPSTGPGSR